MNRFGDNIRYLRKQRHMTQTELGHALGGKAKSTIASYESGARLPIASDLREFANYFGISVDHLMNEDLTVVTDLDAKMKGEVIGAAIERARVTDDEFDKIMTYIDFIISQRKR